LCVQGAGLLGLYASILFKEAGYKEIFCSDIHHDRLDMAAKFGALPIKLGRK
jgi:threonine dehydrogenase-like Zn-dependent dehydrogenase